MLSNSKSSSASDQSFNKFLDKILEEQASRQEKMDKRHRKLNSELNEELIQRRVKMEDFESFLDEVIKKAETKLNTFASPEKENRQTQTPETVKRKFVCQPLQKNSHANHTAKRVKLALGMIPLKYFL